nr:O-antigen ligase family protein [uncultured Desulfobacter sp.]
MLWLSIILGIAGGLGLVLANVIMGAAPTMVVALPFLVLLVLPFRKLVKGYQIILLFLICLIPMDVFAVIPGADHSTTLFKLLFPFVFIVFVGDRLLGDEPSMPLNAMDKWLLFYALFNCILVITAVNRLQALDTMRRYISMWAMYYLFSRALAKGPWPDWTQKAVIFSAAVSVLFGLKAYMDGQNPFSELGVGGLLVNDVRITGASGIDPNAYSILLIVALMWAVVCAVGRKDKFRLFYMISAGLILTGIGLTYSRSAYLTLIASFMFLLFKIRNLLTPTHIVALLLLVLCSLPFAPDSVVERFETLFISSQRQADYSVQRRANYYNVAANILKDHAFFGCGPGNFPVLHQMAKYQDVPALVGVPRMAHSMYLTVITESGIFGFIFFTGFLISTYLRQQAVYDRLDGHFNFVLALMCSFVALLVMGLFLHLQITKYLWLVFAMTRAMDDQSDGQQEIKSVATPCGLKG